MRYLKFFAFFLTVGLSSGFGFDLSGNELLHQLKAYSKRSGLTDDELLKAGRAYGYIGGIYDLTKANIEIPQDITPSQIIDIVHKYLRNNPGMLHRKAYKLVDEAITCAFTQEPE
jgi:hypothetical protein